MPHREGRSILRVANNLRASVPQLAPVDALAEIEARVSRMDQGECLAVLGAAARLSAAAAARNLTLAAFPAPGTPPIDLLDAKAAARHLGVSLPTLYRLVRRGQLTSIRISSDTLRFSPIDIEEFLNTRRSTTPGLESCTEEPSTRE